MSLAERLKRQFGARDRLRGQDCFDQGRVRLAAAGESSAVATVAGSRQYAVRFDGSQLKDGGPLFARCECPRYEEGIWCKHVWATVLALDAEGAELGGGSRRFRLARDDDSILDEPGEDGERDLAPAPRPPTPSARWQQQLAALERSVLSRPPRWREARHETSRELLFAVDAAASRTRGELAVQFFERKRKKNGEWGRVKELKLTRGDVGASPDPADRELVEILLALGVRDVLNRGWSYWGEWKAASALIPATLHRLIVPRLAATGRLHWAGDLLLREPREPLRWDDGPAFRLSLQLARDRGVGETALRGSLRRGTEERSTADIVLLLPSGLIFFSESIGFLENPDDLVWTSFFKNCDSIVVPEKETRSLVERLWSLPERPPLELPPELVFQVTHVRPTPWVRFLRPDPRDSFLSADLQFDYQGTPIDAGDPRGGFLKGSKWTPRDFDVERSSVERLDELGFELNPGPRPFWLLDAERLARVVPRLLEEGFVVLAEGRRVRTPQATRLAVASGIDWLDLEGEIDFEGEIVSVPEVLVRLAEGQRFIRLSDGSEGMLPEEWLERAGLLLALSPERREKALRFRPFHALLLDALLESESHFRPDEGFVRLRERLRSFRGIEPVPVPEGFQGVLRDYQRDGLAWISFLAEYGFGGCLADDMGLGKTIQTLAFLERRRARGERTKPSLVVVPRSLAHNWLAEAARFVPHLGVRAYTARTRSKDVFRDGAADVVVTTYGVVRRDFATLADVEFGAVVLDEAQTIKNELSQTAKACRLLRAEHRLALSGTPVENHLGELWSLFDFLNPGMLGRLVRSREDASETDTALLARAVRPFILRRTKEQVLRELPPKYEQTILCPLHGRQRKLYDELRRHYQLALAERIEDAGLARSKMWVIEALLRLRQAACHPDLLERSGSEDGSAKLETLLPRLEEVVAEGHKALVFSQFTTFLAIVRRRLDERGIVYEYLDGKTRDRKARVARFQTEPECGVFLVSLKAGGLGLNLTAADYVFILDPWWNPAVEAQAIDRAHRIGQTRPVFAYRIIAENTVEEKILQLQQSKRDLADAILAQDNALIRNLTAEDLELLLS